MDPCTWRTFDAPWDLLTEAERDGLRALGVLVIGGYCTPMPPVVPVATSPERAREFTVGASMVLDPNSPPELWQAVFGERWREFRAHGQVPRGAERLKVLAANRNTGAVTFGLGPPPP